ncbi:CDP-alcohol phosphatidyltransferase family protein [Candidatus Pacearchaeota archaeon]|nr:CDP-alcohol phosphatidyltransferase family protein [Candidatus Pacearchaeota archaeon]
MTLKLSEVKPFFGSHLDKPLVKYFYYYVAIFFSWIYINLGLSAHIVNLLGLLASLSAAGIIFFTGGKWMILAGILIMFAYVSDLCDGTVARAYNKKNAMGKWLDESAGFIGISLVFFAFMMRTLISTQDLWIIVLGFFAIFGYLMMNMAAILSEIIRTRFKLDNPAEKIRKKAGGFLRINPGLFAFSFDIQWTFVAICVMFNAPYILFLVFGTLSNLQWMARYFIFFGK